MIDYEDVDCEGMELLGTFSNASLITASTHYYTPRANVAVWVTQDGMCYAILRDTAGDVYYARRDFRKHPLAPEVQSQWPPKEYWDVALFFAGGWCRGPLPLRWETFGICPT